MQVARRGIVAAKAAATSALLSTPVLLPLGSALPGGTAETPRWRATEGEVRVICPLTVGGSFEARTAALGGVLAVAAAEPSGVGVKDEIEVKVALSPAEQAPGDAR
jgi:hypothetical protein